MAIISMLRKTLAKVVESTVTIEEQLPMRRKNMVRFRQNDFDSDEFDEFDEQHEKKIKKKSKKVNFDIVKRGVYC
jgi:hypothetical protein